MKVVQLCWFSISLRETPVSLSNPAFARRMVVSGAIRMVPVPVFSKTVRYRFSDRFRSSSAFFFPVMSLKIPSMPAIWPSGL
ncbi:MAG: hypothetical protein A4E42_01773 [Methanoregulaceae archaeon PtaU1.Bin222]|nr:MAG: hypothetical protein A4E42_01773 [Methanoregulaceae archaeon PtaU1.Bin222]